MAEKEYIERELLIWQIASAQNGLQSCDDRVWDINKKYFKGLAWARRLALDAPAADVVEVRHGKWEESEIPEEKYVCSVCGGACWYYDYQGELAKSRFCPNCGAKMDGGVVE